MKSKRVKKQSRNKQEVEGRFLVAALELAARGFPVFPVTRGAKKPPCISGWPNLASTDPDVIKGWWAEFRGANVAVVTGTRSGLLVLDVDPRNGGDETLKKLVSENGPLPDTITADTPSGGKHFFFKMTERLKNSAGRIGPGIDVRGEGGYVVVAPSVVNGRPYAWTA